MNEEQMQNIIDDTYDESRESLLWSMAGDFYNRRMLSMIIFICTWALLFVAGAIYSGIQFFKNVETQSQIMYAVIFLTCCQFLGLMKIFAWQMIHRNGLKREIKRLLEMDFIVICCGGGGIPVIREGRAFSGVDAVIDKDLASALLAQEVGADLFVIATDVEGVMLDFGGPNQALLHRLKKDEAAQLIEDGHFGSGSMGPKVEAAIQFMDQTGKRAFIASIADIERAITGKAGTEFV